MNDESFKVLATLAAYRIVAGVTATGNTCQYPLNVGVSQFPLGVSINEVKDTTSSLPVRTSGIARVLFNDTVASGSLVTADTSGRAIPFVAVTAPTCYLGTLIGPDVDSTGAVAEVLINKGFVSIP
jgi:hypothetical protein